MGFLILESWRTIEADGILIRVRAISKTKIFKKARFLANPFCLQITRIVWGPNR
jgi:hypothetical protein